MAVALNEFLTNNRGILLAYDHGIEHGPTDFNEFSVDPQFIMDLASKAGFNGLVLQKGLAEKYYDGRIPMILKLNGKTNLVHGDPVSRQICSVEEAVSLHAKAVGYTIYPGSIHESIMFREFGKIQVEAHKRDLPVITWIYPRGKNIKDDTSSDVVSYAARIGLEIGSDAVKIKYSGTVDSFRWAVKAAGRARVFMSGGPLANSEKDFLRQVREVMEAGATGVAVGRNVWQSKNPLKMSEALKRIIIDDWSLTDAEKALV
ncbi:MAG: aldolase [Candidatus Bathyarchaeota archaeon]|nr:aldolase [Candidatus Bathyarchaeota archaeon]